MSLLTCLSSFITLVIKVLPFLTWVCQQITKPWRNQKQKKLCQQQAERNRLEKEMCYVGRHGREKYDKGGDASFTYPDRETCGRHGLFLWLEEQESKSTGLRKTLIVDILENTCEKCYTRILRQAIKCSKCDTIIDRPEKLQSITRVILFCIVVILFVFVMILLLQIWFLRR